MKQFYRSNMNETMNKMERNLHSRQISGKCEDFYVDMFNMLNNVFRCRYTFKRFLVEASN